MVYRISNISVFKNNKMKPFLAVAIAALLLACKNDRKFTITLPSKAGTVTSTINRKELNEYIDDMDKKEEEVLLHFNCFFCN